VGVPSEFAGKNNEKHRTPSASFAPRKSYAHKKVGKFGPVAAVAASRSKSEKNAEKATPKLSNKKSFLPVAKVVDDKTGLELECVVHQTFEVKGKGAISLLEPLDIPIQILRGEGADDEDMGDLNDEELNLIIDDLAMALAKRRLRLYRSAYCLTVRGALRYYDGDVVILDDGGGDESEGIEICNFASEGSFYMAYTPVEPLLLAARQVEGSNTLQFIESDMDDAALQRQMLQLRLQLEVDAQELEDDDDYEDNDK